VGRRRTYLSVGGDWAVIEGVVFMIEDYRFGRFTLDGEAYTSDAVIHGDRVEAWWREKGHRVACADIEDLTSKSPATIVIGTGAMGLMKVPAETRRFIEEKGIELVVDKTAAAIRTYNRLRSQGRDVAIAMHLTC